MIKKVLHKWHWFWFKKHLNFLMKEYKADAYNFMYKAIDDYFKEMSSVAIINTSTEELVNDLIDAAEGETHSNKGDKNDNRKM